MMLMTWHTRFSFGRSAADMQNEQIKAQIDDTATLVDIMLDGGDAKVPAWHMWRGYLDALLIMGMLWSMEWTFNRGYEDKVFWKFSRLADSRSEAGEFLYAPPPWFRDPDVCRSHRSALMGRYPDAYDTELWPGTPEKMPILWPTVSEEDPAVYELRVAKADFPALRAKELVLPKSIKSRVVNI